MRSPLVSVTPAARPAPHGHLARFGRVSERRAVADREVGESARDAMHSALDQPNALALDMRDQHQRCGRQEWGRSAIGGIAAEQLAQPGIPEVVVERAPHADERADLPEVAKAAKAEGGDQSLETRPLRADEGPLERLVDALRAGAEIAIAARLGRSRESSDCVG